MDAPPNNDAVDPPPPVTSPSAMELLVASKTPPTKVPASHDLSTVPTNSGDTSLPIPPITNWGRRLTTGRQTSAIADLLPGGPAGLTLPLLLAAYLPTAKLWLGEERLARIAEDLNISPRRIEAILNTKPVPPVALGDSNTWESRRHPLLLHDRTTRPTSIAWLDLWWRNDPRSRRPRDQGSFAMRITLPEYGRIEIRGRLEEERFDAVLDTEANLSPSLAADLQDSFGQVIKFLGLQGSLTVRHRSSDRRT